MGGKVALMARNKSGLSLFILALVVGGLSASATGLLNTASGGYLVCVNTKSKLVTHPGTSSCPKGSKQLTLGAQGAAGINGLTGAEGLPGRDGKDGRDGKTLWNGTTDPAITWGAPGDMFINSVTKTLFGPKDLTTGWPAGVSMVGPQGPQGPQGLTGLQGAQGIGGSGPQGATGSAGATGPAGAAGATGAAGAAGAAGVLTCAQGGTCVIGDTGPGGGKVFIVRTATTAAPWRYMEAAATNTWNGGTADPTVAWCSNTNTRAPNLADGTTTSTTTSDGIGAGYANTQRMLRGCTFGAANLVAAYSGGGKSNWHLPSKDELTAFYAQRTTIGGYANVTDPLTATNYWSSSELGANDARSLETDGSSSASSKSETRRVRPVRAFG